MLTYCVGEARRVLSFSQHLTSEQRPPPAIWHSRKKCTQWIEDHMPGKEASGGGDIWFSDSEVESSR